jgi:CubicO group peptidase (beta-lactamase class C family)
MRQKLLVSIAIIVLTVSTLSAQTVPSTGIDPAGMASFNQLAVYLLNTYKVPGGSIAVVKDGRLVFARGYGYANKETGELVQPSSLFRIASLAKPITSAAIMLLVQQGRLDLDAKVFTLLDDIQPLPGKTVVDSRIYDITIRHLLQHSGGWNRDTTFDPMFMPVTIAQAAGTAAPANATTIARFMMGQPLQFTPGTNYNYSNFGYTLLGRVIEKISGTTYENFVKTNVLAQSGATCMRIGRSFQSQGAANEVRYYDFSKAPLVPSILGNGQLVPRPDGGFYLEAMDAHGGWLASPADYLRFMLRVDNRSTPPDLLSSPSIATMIARPSFSYWSSSPYWYALGWDVRPTGTDANWWHTGGLAGTSTLAVRSYHGYAWAAFFNGQPQQSDDFYAALDSGMWNALAGVTAWPSGDLFSSISSCSTAQPPTKGAPTKWRTGGKS